MRHGIFTLLALCALFQVAIACQGAAENGISFESGMAMPASQSQEMVAWVKQHAFPLRTVDLDGGDDQDLRPVTKAIHSGTRIVAFGEGMHGQREFLALRNRLFAYLVEHHGVTAYAGETSFTEAIQVDDYIVNGGRLTQSLIASVYIHHPGKSQSSKEDRQLVEWMRAYNLRPTTRRPVRFYGIDSCTGHNDKGQSPCMQAAVEGAIGYVRMVEPNAARIFERRLASWPVYANPVRIGDIPAPGTAPGQALKPEQRDGFTAAIADLLSLFAERHVKWVSRTSSIAYHRAYRSAVIVRQLDAQVRMNIDRPSSDDINISGSGEGAFRSGRDSAMAENVLWALEREGKRGRIFLFAHDLHLDKAAQMLAGAHLHEILGDQIFLIGSTSAAQRDQSLYPSLDALLAAAGLPLFFLDFSQMPPLQTAPQEGGTYWGNWHIAPHWRVQDSYDAMIFVRSLNPVRRDMRD